MGVLDIDKLTSALSADAPCGPDLEYDPAFGELERSAQFKPEQVMGDSVIPAEEPNWRDVKRQSLELFDRTRDLRVATHLAQAALRTDGITGFAEALELLKGLLEEYWVEVHPMLDPDDDNDPVFRVNTLESLSKDETLKGAREMEIVAHPEIGRYSLKDYEIATGAIPLPPGGDAEPPDINLIEAAFSNCELEHLTASREAAVKCDEALTRIRAVVAEQAGAAQAPDLADLMKVIGEARKVLDEKLSARGVATPDAGGAPAEAGAPVAAGAPGAVAAAPVATGEVNSREDVIRTLDRVVQYFSRHEPSSPIPLLLKAANKLVSKDFMAIVRELTPEFLERLEQIAGTGSGGGGGGGG